MPTSPPTLPLRWCSRWRTDTGSSYNLVTGNDINVISAAAATFSGTYNPLPPVSTLYDFGNHYHVQTGSTNNSETERNIDAISRANAMGFQVRLRSNRRHPTSENSVTCELPVWGTVSTSGLYLMLFSEIRYCRRALFNRWDHLHIVFRRKIITTSAILEFLDEGSVGWGWHVGYTCEKRASKNIGIATEIASISVSVVKLLVLPVWGTVSTSDLCLMLFSKVGQCWYLLKWIGHDRKLSQPLTLSWYLFPSTGKSALSL